jgi:PTS system glucose-specific IIA component
MFSFFKKSVLVYAPTSGEVKRLEDVDDEVFSAKMAGDGVAILPESGLFCSPVDGKITRVFPTKHAFSIESRGVEILVHIGLDTVELKGEGFELLKSEGESVRVGDEIVRVDLELLKSRGKDIITPIVVADRSIKDIKLGSVERGDLIFKV